MKPSPSWRPLAAFWTAILLLGATGLTTLQLLGPPQNPPISAPPPTPVHDHPVDAPAAPEPHPAAQPQPVAESHPDPAPTTVAAPIPALMEPARALPDAQLPRVAPDGRLSRIVYAAPRPATPAGTPLVALLVAGFGLSERETRAAITGLPGPVSFAVSPYATGIAPLLSAARAGGHELLASIPMEPQGFPGNDEGPAALLTGKSPDENAASLEWALSRTPGIVGATGAADGMRGERFADIPALFDPMIDTVTRRGLLYVDARPGRAASPGTPVRAIDTVLDDQLGRAEIDARLQSLERTAQERGSAIGLVGALRPATIERIAAWSRALPARGLALVPVSAVVNP